MLTFNLKEMFPYKTSFQLPSRNQLVNLLKAEDLINKLSVSIHSNRNNNNSSNNIIPNIKMNYRVINSKCNLL